MLKKYTGPAYCPACGKLWLVDMVTRDEPSILFYLSDCCGKSLYVCPSYGVVFIGREEEVVVWAWLQPPPDEVANRMWCRACGQKCYLNGMDGGMTDCKCINKHRTGTPVPPGAALTHQEVSV